MLRMNTPASCACACMRTRSPSMAPPLNGLVGSTASTPTDVAGLAPPRDEAVDQRALARARRAGDADEKRASRSREQLAHERGPLIGVVLDERDAACNAARIAGEDRICESGQPAEFITDCVLRDRTGTMRTMNMRLAVLALTLMAVDAVDRPRRRDRVPRPQFGRRRSVGHARFRRRRQPARRRVRIRVRQLQRKIRRPRTPSLRTTVGQRLRPDVRPARISAVCDDGRGDLSRAAWQRSRKRRSLLNNGGGVKINIAGPAPRAHRLSDVHPERQSAAHERAADLCGAESGVLKEQRAEGRGHRAVCPLPSALCPICVAVYFE